MAQSLHIQAFGKLKLQYQGKWLTRFPTRHVEELAGYLLLHQQVPHDREKLATLLWPDHPPQKGRACLSTALWRLRCFVEQLGLSADEIFHTTRHTIALVLGDTAVLDTVHFVSLINQAKINPEERMPMLQQAIVIYRGELYEGIYSDWCLVEREHLARQYLWALGQLMHQYLQTEQFPQALEIGYCLLNHDPLREEVHRAIMLCHQKCGQYNQALQQFQICSDLLQEELGIIPMPETLALYQQILANRFQTFRNIPQQSQDLNLAYTEFLRASNNLTKLLNL